MRLEVQPHPSLRLAAFTANYPAALGEIPSPPSLRALLQVDATNSFSPSEPLRQAVRAMLREGGYKPTGRGKPASEYLTRAGAEEGGVRSINLAVDACNAMSLHTGLPVSLVDVALMRPPLRVAIADPGARYAFNASGQEIDLGGLLCLFDSDGPCANAVKDSQRTKTHGGTRATLSLVWGCAGWEERTAQGVAWYRELLEGSGVTTEVLEVRDGVLCTSDDA